MFALSLLNLSPLNSLLSNLRPHSRLPAVLLLGLIFAMAAGCGGGGSTTASTTGTGTGTVALLLTDAPSDIFEEINITVIKAELLSDDDAAVTLYEGERTFNLLELTDARIFAVREDIAAGSYSKIRLTLSKIELVDYNDQADPANYLTYYPDLPGNGKLDLNPRGSFEVVAGATLTIQIDMDAGKSIHIVEKGNSDEYNFRPVVFIDIVTDDFAQRYLQLHGDITAINASEQSFKLCNTAIPVQITDESSHTGSSCVYVETADNTAIFDINGKPAAFTELLEGEPATVFGHLQSSSRAQQEDDDDGQGDNDDEHELENLVLKAALIELGPLSTFLSLNGSATSGVASSDLFTMDVAPGQGLSTPLNLGVQIQPGTLLTDLKGAPVASSLIDTGKLVNVRGVLDVGTDTLFASLIVLDTDSSSQLTGSIVANPDNSCGFTLLTLGGDVSIATDSTTKAFLIDGGSSSPINVTELNAGRQADVYGNTNSATACFDADTIISY